MDHDTLAALRASLLAVLLLIVLWLCITEKEFETHIEEPPTPATSEQATEPAMARTAEPEEQWAFYGSFELTAYCPCEKCCGYWATVRPTDENGNPIIYTSTGEIAEAGTTIAVDPNIIPYGSKVKINDHIYIAQDTGGAITGAHIDIFFDDHASALEFGRQSAPVYVLIE